MMRSLCPVPDNGMEEGARGARSTSSADDVLSGTVMTAACLGIGWERHNPLCHGYARTLLTLNQ